MSRVQSNKYMEYFVGENVEIEGRDWGFCVIIKTLFTSLPRDSSS